MATSESANTGAFARNAMPTSGACKNIVTIIYFLDLSE